MSETYLLTGVGGHLGNTVARMLLDRGDTVRGFARLNENVSMLKDKNFSVYRGDIRDRNAVRLLFEGLGKPPVVIHCAGVVSVESRHNPMVEAVNVGGTRNVLALCGEYGVKKLVHVSSVHAIPELPEGQEMCEVDHFSPDAVRGDYAKSKAEATQLVLDAAKAGLNATVVHPSGIIGPNDYGKGHLTQMIMDFVNGGLSVCIKGGFDFVDVRDVAQGILSAVENGGQGECYILSNRYYSIRDVMHLLSGILGRKDIKTVFPMWIAKATAPIAELYYKIRREAPLFTPYSLSTLTGNALYSCKKAVRELGYSTRNMRETLQDTVTFLAAHGRLKEAKLPAPLRKLSRVTA